MSFSSLPTHSRIKDKFKLNLEIIPALGYIFIFKAFFIRVCAILTTN